MAGISILNGLKKLPLIPTGPKLSRGNPTVERRFRAIPESGGRILRVACVETNSSIRVISVMFDRNARRKP